MALLATALLLSLAWAARPHARSSPVGASACASCQTRIHDTWKSGRHSKMVQPAAQERLKQLESAPRGR